MSSSIRTAAFIFGLAFASAAFAQAAPPMVKGTIEKVDASTGKLSINHEQIPNLDMEGGMTMVFKVGDPAMLTSVKAGQKVRFTAERVNGQLTVTKIQPGK